MNYINDSIGPISFIFIFIIFVKRKSKGNFKEYGFLLTNYKNIFKGFIIGVLLVCIATYTSSSIIGKGHYLNEYSLLIRISIYWLLIPISEEIFFRSWLQTLISKKTGKSFAISKFDISYPVILTSIIFGVYHSMLLFMNVSILKVVHIIGFTMILGLFSGYFREKTKSILPSIIMHISYNTAGGILATSIL
ncbi:MAG: CPBP family intramembrane metalloprotease [Candidatus Delongbacteria bacterium]|nr:CPBP family intramembrane metalloprotease [Candidatus Delongbacteria bacterium]MBN2834799.1 CPBP family intramembrane metalloprotease [Candidatus Delongbacteria bacterium]